MNKTHIPLSKECQYCGSVFSKTINESIKNWTSRHKYCSRACADKAKLGKPSWNKGLHNWWTPNPKGVKRNLTPEWRKKLSDAGKRSWDERYTKEEQKILRAKQVATRKANGNFKGTLGRKRELSTNWLGDRATYNAIHRWIQKNWEKTGICENCGATPKPCGRKRWGTEWHNLNRKYNRENKKDWIELCSKCHHLFDKKWTLEVQI